MFFLSRFARAAADASIGTAAIPLTELSARPVRIGNHLPRKVRQTIQPIRNWNIVSGDQVVVLAGDAKGERGIVKKVCHGVFCFFLQGVI